MKTYKQITFIVVLLVMFSVGSARAALIGLTPTYPDLFADTQGTFFYDESADLVTVDSFPHILYHSATSGDLDYIYDSTAYGYKSYTAQINVDNNGDFISGGNQNTLTVIGRVDVNSTTYDGILLEGKITNFGWDYPFNLPNGTYQFFDFTFDIAGGLLADLFGGLDGPAGAIVSCENSGFGSGGWVEDFGGTNVKTNNFPTPIPTAIWLFGSGLIGLVGVRKKFRKS